MECSTPSGPMKSTPVARLPSVRILDTNVSGRTSALRSDPPAGHHHVAGIYGVLDAVRSDEVHPGGPVAVGADPRHERLGTDLRPEIGPPRRPPPRSGHLWSARRRPVR